MAERIVSLIPSATEIVHALGLSDRLVGRSHECDYPDAVVGLPVCTEPKFELTGSGADLDARVKAILQDALSVYRVHEDVLGRLQPDVIITQSMCEVCAVSLADVERAVCSLVASQPQIVALEPNALADVWNDIRRVAGVLGVPEKGEMTVVALSARMEAVHRQASELPAKPRVACIEWIEPLMAAGNWMPELVTMAGGINLFGEAGAHSPWITWGDLRLADPDVIVVLPCGWDIPRARHEMAYLTSNNGWESLRAVRSGRVYLTDGNQYFNRPGPRLAESLEILVEVLHPDAFDWGHRGTGWEPF